MGRVRGFPAWIQKHSTVYIYIYVLRLQLLRVSMLFFVCRIFHCEPNCLLVLISNAPNLFVERAGGTFALCMLKSGSKKAFANRGYEFLGCGNEDEARAACNPAPLPMPKSLESQLNLEAAVAMARKEGVQIHPCGMGVWLGARWYGSSSAGRWLWDDGSMLLNGSFDTVEASVGVYTNWAPGQPSAIRDHETEPLLYLSYPSGRWHDARLQKHQFAVVCQETVAQGTGSLRLQGPFSRLSPLCFCILLFFSLPLPNTFMLLVLMASNLLASCYG